MLKALLIFIQIFLISTSFLLAQAVQPNTFTIQSSAQKLYEDQPDSIKIKVNGSLENMMAKVLSATSVTDVSADTLKFLKSLISADEKFRLITWAYPVSGNRHQYSGFIQLFNKNGDSDTLINLRFTKEKDDLFTTLPAEEWPGAVYFDLIEKKSKQGTTYTLLGWMGAGPGKARRIIEVLDFDNEGAAIFGKPVFIIDAAKNQSRMIFEYTDQIPFHLAYEMHPLPGKKKKKEGMIVFNRLVGNNPVMGRMYKGSVPDYSTFDGLVFGDGKWRLYRDLDLRVDTDKLDDKPPRENGLAPSEK